MAAYSSTNSTTSLDNTRNKTSPAPIVLGEKDTISVASPLLPSSPERLSRTVSDVDKAMRKVAVAAGSSLTGEVSEDNANGVVTKSPWIKPVNAVVEAAAPVMGDSWPTISESTRPLVKLSLDSSKPGDTSSSMSKGPVKSNAYHRANTNGNPSSTSGQNTHPHPVRQRPFKRGGGAGGGSGQSGFSRLPPPPTTPPPFPLPYVLVPPMMDLSVREPALETRPVGGVGSQSNSGNYHSSQRHASRRGNFGPRPRGDGMHYNDHGGRRDQDRNWNVAQNSTARDSHMHQMASTQPTPMRFMRPGIPGPASFIPPPLPLPLPPPPPHMYGNPMHFEFPPPFVYGPHLTPEPRGVSLIPPPAPAPIVFPPVELNSHTLLLNQIDYYFSDANLVKDVYLRSNMDEEGWVHISLIANFPRVQRLTGNVQLILDVLGGSTVVEVQGDNIRRRDNWKKWIHPNKQGDANMALPSPSESNDNMLETSIQNMPINESHTHNVNTVETMDSHSEIIPGESSSEATIVQTRVVNGANTYGEVRDQFLP